VPTTLPLPASLPTLPPRPDICGSTTPMANAVATTASTALPPARIMARPASLANAFAFDRTVPDDERRTTHRG
jgi:hypothetical protein